MTWKTVWREGAFIRPQHFQQQEKFLLSALQHRVKSLQSFAWGVSKLQINQSELDVGQFSLLKCSAIFSDGTAYCAPDEESLPLPLYLSDGTRNAIIYLVLPYLRDSGAEVGNSDEPSSLIRFKPVQKQLIDRSDDNGKTSSIEMGELRVQLLYEELEGGDDAKRVPDGMMKIPIAHIKEVVASKIVLDETFMPCALRLDASPTLKNFLAEFESMVSTRAAALAQRVSGSGGSGGVAEVSDFMLLQLLNRIEPQLNQLNKSCNIHPFDVYMMLLSFSGELSTFMKAEKRPIAFPTYNHEEPTSIFQTVMSDIFSSFSVVLEQIATSIPLSPPKQGIRAARLTNKEVLNSGNLVLAVTAQVSSEMIRSQFPAQIKIGPGEKIFQLIQSALPGIELQPLPQAPREIPYHAGFQYFELNSKNPLWEELKASKGMAFHVSGNFPGLELQLWAINRK
ncbi:type VI secretion system baseplate subunit TssK [Aestuariibacter salexigens]|uniref:type VI secretion system baseplate subunit TssK n=1 Tax=Aestuariibacter salexigens TaxID=226010 RepID=UPI0003F61B23|nr:type VI secretion system baseplate subunit TssK [Aestuariibacter salexigens]